MGEEPILKNVPTWRCRERESMSYVMDNLHELVVKQVNGSGGYGCSWARFHHRDVDCAA